MPFDSGAGKGGGHALDGWGTLTSLVGRTVELDEVAALLGRERLVTITGPGGVGKTRLAVEVARRIADRFPGGLCFVELGAIVDEARVPAEVAAAVGARQVPRRPPLESLVAALAPRRLLIVLDNCEHLLNAAAELCERLLRAADDIRILVTSREQLWVDGESRYRLSPLKLPASGDPTEITRSAAITLFAERARHADPRFSLTAENASLAARVVTRLDGMPLAIELAAARVEALGMAGLADRVDDALRLLAGSDRLVAGRHKGLAAMASWSYQLLSEHERRVFRRLAAFPGPFGLEAAEALAGQEAEPVVQHLVDCSLLLPPRPGPDQRMRYSMLSILRAYGRDRLSDDGEEPRVMATMADFALSVAEQALTGMETSSRELAALQWLDAEDATLVQAMDWLLERDPRHAQRLAAALAPWLRMRGRSSEAYEWLETATRCVDPGGLPDTRAQVWLGILSSVSSDWARSSEHFSVAINAAAVRSASPELVDALIGRAIILIFLGDVTGAARDVRHGLAAARNMGSPRGEAQALTGLAAVAHFAGGPGDARDWARQARELLEEDMRGYIARWLRLVLAFVLSKTSDLDGARRLCADGLVRSREVADLVSQVGTLVRMADLERKAGRSAVAGERLREAAEVAPRAGNHLALTACINQCAQWCASTGRLESAVTLWAALNADLERNGCLPVHPEASGWRETTRQAERALTPL
jgi:predicted ATPase